MCQALCPGRWVGTQGSVIERLHPVYVKSRALVVLLQVRLQAGDGEIVASRKCYRGGVTARIGGKHELEGRAGLTQVRDGLESGRIRSGDRPEELPPGENDRDTVGETTNLPGELRGSRRDAKEIGHAASAGAAGRTPRRPPQEVRVRIDRDKEPVRLAPR